MQLQIFYFNGKYSTYFSDYLFTKRRIKSWYMQFPTKIIAINSKWGHSHALFFYWKRTISRFLFYLLFTNNELLFAILFLLYLLCLWLDMIFVAIYLSLNVFCLLKLDTKLLSIYICIDCKQPMLSFLSQNADNIYNKERSLFW